MSRAGSRQPPDRAGAGLSRVARARAGFTLGVVLIALGLGYQLDVGWSLVVLGAGLVVGFVWLYDVDEPAETPAYGVRGEDW